MDGARGSRESTFVKDSSKLVRDRVVEPELLAGGSLTVEDGAPLRSEAAGEGLKGPTTALLGRLKRLLIEVSGAIRAALSSLILKLDTSAEWDVVSHSSRPGGLNECESWWPELPLRIRAKLSLRGTVSKRCACELSIDLLSVDAPR